MGCFKHQHLLLGRHLFCSWTDKVWTSEKFGMGAKSDNWHLELTNEQWVAQSVSGPRPPARYKHAAAVVDEKLYIFGGNRNGRYLSDTQVFDLKTLAWSTLNLNTESNADKIKDSLLQEVLPATSGHRMIGTPLFDKLFYLCQEYSASANEATQEIYGTEEGLGRTYPILYCRYKQWLDKLVYIGIRESVAYGSWYLSFNTLYRSTQVFAVLLGGMSILTGHVSAEQLMKYVLYCEWLIYAAWRLEDNSSSLLQAIGASEKVFQLMVLMPSDQFLSKGMKLQRLVGKIEFVNVSFYYPSRSMIL